MVILLKITETEFQGEDVNNSITWVKLYADINLFDSVSVIESYNLINGGPRTYSILCGNQDGDDLTYVNHQQFLDVSAVMNQKVDWYRSENPSYYINNVKNSKNQNRFYRELSKLFPGEYVEIVLN